MYRYLLFPIFLAGLLVLEPVVGQQVEPLILVGIGKGEKHIEQLTHLYAINDQIVNTVAKTGSLVLDRAFGSATARTKEIDSLKEIFKRPKDARLLGSWCHLRQRMWVFLRRK